MRTPMLRATLLISLCLTSNSPLVADIPDNAEMVALHGVQRVLLSGCEQSGEIRTGGWHMDQLTVTAETDAVDVKFGRAALRLRGVSDIAGGKGDCAVSSRIDGEARWVGGWLYLEPNSNVKDIGFQFYDAEGEALIRLIPADWHGWQWVEVDLQSAVVKQAYNQPDKNGKADYPLGSVHLAWFTVRKGESTFLADEIVAAVATDSLPAADSPVRAQLSVESAIETDQPFAAQLLLNNYTDADVTVDVAFELQRNPALYDVAPPDPIFGSDHALEATSRTEFDGKVIAENTLTDNDRYTSAEAGKGTEVFQYVDLGRSRTITRIDHLAGDANWIWKVDIAASQDGETYEPIPGLQGAEWYKKWGLQRHLLDEPVTARYLKLRYHADGEEKPRFRMPLNLSVYDGTGDETMPIPPVGQVVRSDTQQVLVPARSYAAASFAGDDTLATGSYLVAARLERDGAATLDYRGVMVMPPAMEEVSAESRLGMNASGSTTDAMRRIGVAWVRFENLKWPFVSPEPDVYRYNGTVGPWHVNHDALFEAYHDKGMHILPYLFLTPRYMQPAEAPEDHKGLTYPPTDFEKYGQFVFQTVARYGSQTHASDELLTDDKRSGLGWIDTYELWNEPNLDNPDWGHWKGPLTSYFDMFRVGAEAAKRADPSAKVANAGFAGINLELVDQLRSYEYPDGKRPLDFVDVLSVHHYTGRIEPELATIDTNQRRADNAVGERTFETDLQRLDAWRDEHKPDMPIWLTETGYDTGGPRGVSERIQASWAVRDAQIILAAGIEKVFLYRETGSGASLYSAAGLVRDDDSLKPAAQTWAVLTRQFEGVGEGKRYPIDDPNARAYLWKRGDETILTTWAITDQPTQLALNLGDCAVTDAFGYEQQLTWSGPRDLSIFPIYITGIDASAATKLWDDVKQHEADEARRIAALENLNVLLLDFGTDENLGVMTIGSERSFAAVTADQTWDPKRGYGFLPEPAMSNEDAKWMSNKLERDGVRMNAKQQFRFIAPPGDYTLRFKAGPFSPSGEMTITGLKGGAQRVTFDKESPAELDVKLTKEPVTISHDGYMIINWLTLIEKH